MQSSANGEHFQIFCDLVKTWTVSQPSDSAFNSALCIPPAIERCEPNMPAIVVLLLLPRRLDQLLGDVHRLPFDVAVTVQEVHAVLVVVLGLLVQHDGVGG